MEQNNTPTLEHILKLRHCSHFLFCCSFFPLLFLAVDEHTRDCPCDACNIKIPLETLRHTDGWDRSAPYQQQIQILQSIRNFCYRAQKHAHRARFVDRSATQFSTRRNVDHHHRARLRAGIEAIGRVLENELSGRAVEHHLYLTRTLKCMHLSGIQNPNISPMPRDRVYNAGCRTYCVAVHLWPEELKLSRVDIVSVSYNIGTGANSMITNQQHQRE